jgi:hypothetical protein
MSLIFLSVILKNQNRGCLPNKIYLSTNMTKKSDFLRKLDVGIF